MRIPLVPLVLATGCSLLVACSDSDDDSGGPSDDPPSADGAPGDTGGDTGGTGGSDTGGDAGGDTGGSDTGGASGEATLYGNVSVDYESFGNETNVSGGFFRFDRALPVSALDEQLPVVESDECEVVEGTGIPNIDTDIDLDDLDLGFSSVGAGEFITLSFPGGTYASLPRQQQFGFTVYTTETEEGGAVPGPIPSGLTLDIPGESGGFPAFSDVPMPVADALELTIDEGDLSVSWNGGSSDVGSISFGLVATGGEGDDITFNVLSCTLVDDGSFTLPEALIEGEPVRVVTATASRADYRVAQEGAALLLLQANVTGEVTVAR